jgi:hypothetical protein
MSPLIPHTISSVCFGCFDTSPKHRNKPKQTETNRNKPKQTETNRNKPKQICWFRKKQTENNRNRFVSVGTEKKNVLFWGPPNRKRFLRFFRFVSVCFDKVLFVSVDSIPVRNSETNRKKSFLVSRNKPKNNWNRLSFGLFRFESKKKFDCFEDTLTHIYGFPKAARKFI